jgi:hypothetical protein
MATLVSEEYNDKRGTSNDKGTAIVGDDTLSELKNLFGISKASGGSKNTSAKDFAVLLGQASAGKVLRGDDFLHLLSGYVQANLSDLRSGMLRLSLNTPCLSYLTSLVKKSRKKSNRKAYNDDNQQSYSANADQVVSQNRRIVLKLAVMLMDLLHLKILSPNRSGGASAPLRVKCDVKMFANLRMLEIHGAELYDLEDLAFLRDRLEVLYIEGSTVHCPGAVLFEPGKLPNPPRNIDRPTPTIMREYHDTKYMWPRLARVKCSNCQMKMLDRSVAFLPKGRVFDFSYNELDVSSFKALALIAQSSLMTSIDLAFNRLSSCESLLMYLPLSSRRKLQSPSLTLNLQSLSLRHNRISTTKGLEVLTNLQYLDLSHNLISSLNDIFNLQNLQELRSFSLEGNPIALHPRYREEIGDIFASTHSSIAENKFLLDGKRMRFKQQNLKAPSSEDNNNYYTNNNKGIYAADAKGGDIHNDGNKAGGKHRRRNTLGFETAITEIENGQSENITVNDRNNDNNINIKKNNTLLRKRDKKKQKKRVATIEDPSAITVPLSPEKKERRRSKNRKKGNKSKRDKLVAIENNDDTGHTKDARVGDDNKDEDGIIGRKKNYDDINNQSNNIKNRDNSDDDYNNSNENGSGLQYGSDAWDEMEQYKLQLQKKMEQYHRKLEKKREVKGANWLESSPSDKPSYLAQRKHLSNGKKTRSRRPSKNEAYNKIHDADEKDINRFKVKSSSSRDNKKSSNSDKGDDVKSIIRENNTSTKTIGSKSTIATDDKNRKDADDDTHLLFQREYLAERHYQEATSGTSSIADSFSLSNKTSNNSTSNPSIKTCILLIEGASFVEVDITGGNICEKMSLDSLNEVSLIHGSRGDTLLKMVFNLNHSMLPVKASSTKISDKRNSTGGGRGTRELLYALHQAGTLEELRCLLQARVIYNMCRNGDRGGFQQFVTLQCLSCEYLFEWDTCDNLPFKCTRCKTSNLRTSRVSPRRKSSSQHRRSSNKDSEKDAISEVENVVAEKSAGNNATAKDHAKIFKSLNWDYFGSKNTGSNDNNDENNTGAVPITKTIDENEQYGRSNNSDSKGQKKGGDGDGEIRNIFIDKKQSFGASAPVRNEIIEEKHDPLANMKIHSNLELYFRERVFCSKMKRNERVTHLIVTMVAVLDPSLTKVDIGTNAPTSSAKKKNNIEGNDQECVVILTDESMYIMKTLDDKSLKFKDNPVFLQVAAYKFVALKQIVIGFWAQRLTLKTTDGMAFVLLTRNRDKTYAILQRLPNLFEIINEDQKMLESLQKNILKDPSANITLFLMLHRRHKDKKRVMPRTLVLTSSGIYLCEEDYANEWGGDIDQVDSPRIKLERFSTIKDIIKLEPSERPTDFTIVVSEMLGIIPRQRRWRLRVDTRAKKAKVLQELRKLIRENL